MNALRERAKELGRALVLGHRGASSVAPENSLLALRRAAELGADGVEFDVQRCASGELVVFHDRTLARCTGVLGSVGEASLTALRRLTLDRVDRAVTGEARGERIPTLAEWLEEAPRGLFLNLEVKCEVVAEAEAAAECARALETTGWAARSILSSFHPVALLVAARAGAVDRGALIDSSRWWLNAAFRAARPVAIHPHHSLVTAASVATWHRRGLAVATWTVDTPADVRRVLEAGVDAVITNRPEVVRPLAEAHARRG